MAFGVALPGLIVWGLGIPSYGLRLIVSNMESLHLQSFKEKYGFLYNGYRYPQAYFWEFIIMYRKIIMIFIQVFLAQQGLIVQVRTVPISTLGPDNSPLLDHLHHSDRHQTTLRQPRSELPRIPFALQLGHHSLLWNLLHLSNWRLSP